MSVLGSDLVAWLWTCSEGNEGEVGSQRLAPKWKRSCNGSWTRWMQEVLQLLSCSVSVKINVTAVMFPKKSLSGGGPATCNSARSILQPPDQTGRSAPPAFLRGNVNLTAMMHCFSGSAWVSELRVTSRLSSGRSCSSLVLPMSIQIWLVGLPQTATTIDLGFSRLRLGP